MATKVCCRRSHEEFEPLCKWLKEERFDIVELDLRGFKKEQIKVMINQCAGIISITGERPLERTMTSCFRKDIKLPADIKINEVRAKFGCGVLTITMPKKPLVLELRQDCGRLGLADREGPLSLTDFGVNAVAVKPDEKCTAKHMAIVGIVGVVTSLVLSGACCCCKFYQLYCHV
ncbi:hypothetical protein SLE2022_130720 [Rubroshorea leprosula]